MGKPAARGRLSRATVTATIRLSINLYLFAGQGQFFQKLIAVEVPCLERLAGKIPDANHANACPLPDWSCQICPGRFSHGSVAVVRDCTHCKS
jgi:hypothetical protein